MKNEVLACKQYSEIRKKVFHDTHQGRSLMIGEHVRLEIKDEDCQEHLWFEVTKIEHYDHYTGECRNKPLVVKNMVLGQAIRFDFPDVEDIYIDERCN